ncbi:carboxynorspermidine decarboxylase [Nostoc sp. 2RC]|uniref:carboxynorspermidine decarboxylase n=1 Tax=Nostoc sp. 2RC TaxID=2485484 RepID=UPI00162AA669|nr:carboxynorspermidine decarboxylase [Nostoc sp. 2RC]MBC1235933.1 carboxynorspermidine decarboxylase [Nostoc sp. 2RC]
MTQIDKVPSPCFVLEQARLEQNLAVFQRVQQEAPIKVLLALKAFSLFHSFPLIQNTLQGASASSLWEVQLAKEKFGKEIHVYSPAYREADIPLILSYASHITFNSMSQWERFYPLIENSDSQVSVGLRINPQYSPVKTMLYNPCQPNTRLGVLPEYIGHALPKKVEGFLSHNLCESDSYALEKTLANIERFFGEFLPQIKWLNLGGGHLMTHQSYDIAHAIDVLCAFHNRHPHIELILEPGSAIVWETGFLLATVQDLIPTTDLTHVMLDVSFTAHMPDCLEMPYKPVIQGAHEPQEKDKVYRMGGSSCLAGDFIGDYAFLHELAIGDRLIFEDMMHYTMVKSTMFNGVVHPSIGLLKKDGTFELWRQFSYEDYRARLG